MNHVKVSDIMTTEAAKLPPDVGIVRALKKLIQNQQSAAAVVDDDGKLLGIISEADCMQAAMTSIHHMQASAQVSDRMCTEVDTVTEDTTLESASELLLKNNRRVLIVVDGKKYVGLLTRQHILKKLIDMLDSEGWKAQY